MRVDIRRLRRYWLYASATIQESCAALTSDIRQEPAFSNEQLISKNDPIYP